PPATPSTPTPAHRRASLSVNDGTRSGLLEAVGVVDHEEPGAIGLPTRNFRALALDLHRLAVRSGALQHPLRRRESDALGLRELLHVEPDPRLHREKAAQRLPDGLDTRGEFAGLRHEARARLVELDHALDVTSVDRIGEQDVEFLGCASWHRVPPVDR